MNTEYNNYRIEIQKLLDKTLFYYPFYSKSDDELISDAFDRGNKQCEFSIFKMGIQEKKFVPAGGGIFEKNFFTLYPLKDGKLKRVEIKLSSFIYPAQWISMLGDKNVNPLFSTYKSQRVMNYGELYGIIENLQDKNVLITTSWDGFGKYGVNQCINLFPIGNKNDWADIIRQEFTKERISLLQEILVSPEKYFNSFPVNKKLALDALKEFEPQIRKEIQYLQNL